MPLCDTVWPGAAPFHSVSVDFPGTDNDPLDPALENYDPSLAFDFGEGVGNGPTFDIAAADCSGGACNFFGLFAQLYCSPFNLPLSTDPSNGDPMVGFDHDLFLSTQGETVESQNTSNNDYTIRPWVANVSFFYCTADNETTCGTNPPDTDAIQANAQTRYNYAVIASPQ